MAQQLLTPALNVFEQMAIDEVIAHANLPEPILRFYHWTEGLAVTFGYSQFYASVRTQVNDNNGPLCRRPTGGGIVFHGTDLTFSLVFQSLLCPTEIYAQLHGSIEQGLMQTQLISSVRQGAVNADVYIPMKNGIASGCFANPVQDDLIYQGKKILGGAIRRFGNTILYQGSLQCNGARTNPMFRRAISKAVAQMLSVSWQTVPVSQDLLQEAKKIAQTKYKTDEWIKKFL